MKPRCLSQICQEEGLFFQKHLRGITYCRLGFNGREIQCKYIEENNDHNGLRRCNYIELKTREIIKKVNYQEMNC